MSYKLNLFCFVFLIFLFLFVFPAADSSSDYSQRTSLDIPGLQQELRATPEGARREADDALPDKIKVKKLLMLTGMLTLSLITIID